jgi:hypothetical protein
MATPRKRSSGFTKPAEEVTEEEQIEGFLDEVATEMFETISQAEEEVKEKTSPAPRISAPQVVEAIIPVDDAGPRFTEITPEPEAVQPVVAAVAPKLHPPKRHPRNIPKFTPYKAL